MGARALPNSPALFALGEALERETNQQVMSEIGYALSESSKLPYRP